MAANAAVLDARAERTAAARARGPQPGFRADADGRWTFASRSWCDFTGLMAGDAAGDGWLNAVHADDQDRVAGEWARAVGAREPFRSVYRMVLRAGGVRVVQCAATRLDAEPTCRELYRRGARRGSGPGRQRHSGCWQSQRSSVLWPFCLQTSLQYLPHFPPLGTVQLQEG